DHFLGHGDRLEDRAVVVLFVVEAFAVAAVFVLLATQRPSILLPHDLHPLLNPPEAARPACSIPSLPHSRHSKPGRPVTPPCSDTPRPRCRSAPGHSTSCPHRSSSGVTWRALDAPGGSRRCYAAGSKGSAP